MYTTHHLITESICTLHEQQELTNDFGLALLTTSLVTSHWLLLHVRLNSRLVVNEKKGREQPMKRNGQGWVHIGLPLYNTILYNTIHNLYRAAL